MAIGKKPHSIPDPKSWQDIIASENPDFRGACCENANFSGNNLSGLNFRSAILRDAEFIGCNLTGANFEDAILDGANFRDAQLNEANFAEADLTNANFYKASLESTMFVGSHLFGTIFRESRMGKTVFADVDMETCVGLETVIHLSPSSIGVECLYQAGNGLPVKFLKGIGLSQILLDYLPDLVEAGRPIQFHSCFISYSHKDELFARKLWTEMKAEQIRVWYAPEEMKGRKNFLSKLIERFICMIKFSLFFLNPVLQAIGFRQKFVVRESRESWMESGSYFQFGFAICKC